MSKESQAFYSNDLLPKKIVEDVERVCRKRKLNQNQKKKLIKAIEKEYLNSSFEPGEAIGIVTAQSLSEPSTQMTMRTYHFAGSAGIQTTLGLPRIIEIFGARKEPSTQIMTIYLKKKYNTKNGSEKIAREIKEKELRDFLKTVSLDLTNKRIKIRLKKVNKSERDEINSQLKKSFKNYKIAAREETITIDPERKEFTVKDLEKIKKKLLGLHISGIADIKNTLVIEDGKDWVINTLGSNFAELLNMDEVDIRRCYTNNIHEIREVLGVEAARNALIREIKQTMQQQGLKVDERHVMLIADIMTFTGSVLSVGRYGVAGMNPSVLTRAGFEETRKHLVLASIRNEADNFDGVFDNVMVNQQVPMGTGMFELVAKMGE